MRETWKKDRDQWIPWEVSYSLKETSRKNKNGDSVTSHSNAMLAVVIRMKKVHIAIKSKQKIVVQMDAQCIIQIDCLKL